MVMTPRLRKFALTAHVTSSVGWLGAVAAFLALAIAGLTSRDALTVRAAYVAMELIGWFVIVPFSLAALLTGLVQSVGTTWGLFQHYWVLAKLVLTIFAVGVLLLHMQPVSHLSEVAVQTTMSSADLRGLRTQIIADAGAGLLVLLVNTALSLYKPRGLTSYGRREQHKRREVSLTDRPSLPGSVSVRPGWEAAARTPRWPYVVGVHAIGLTVLFVIFHLSGGGLRGH